MDRRRFLVSAIGTACTASRPTQAFAFQAAGQDLDPELRQRLEHDPLRPQFHLIPQAGSVGDPCAPRSFGNEHHVFFHGSFGGRGWSHTRSSDLIHWQHMPKALTPSDGSYDTYGTFTGSVLPGTEDASIIYTGVTKVTKEQETIRNEALREVQCIATSVDADLRTWRKRERPIIEAPPSKIVGFRDPFAWKDGDTWYAGVGSGFEHKGGAVLLYRSKDTRTWEYLHPLAEGIWNGQLTSNPVGSAEMWECPDFFPLGDKYVLIYSTEHHVYWQVGAFDKRELRFHAERKGLLDYGAYYAPKSMLDNRNRRILWGWVQETRSRDEARAAGWSGAISLPRVLSLGPDNELEMAVAPEFSSLRTNTVAIKGTQSPEKLQAALSKATFDNRAGELTCMFAARQSRGCGLELRMLSDSGASTVLALKFREGQRDLLVEVGDRTVPLNPGPDGTSFIQILVDGSVVETFIDKRHVITTRSYVEPGSKGRTQAVWSGESRALKSLTISNIKPISDNRLTG